MSSKNLQSDSQEVNIEMKMSLAVKSIALVKESWKRKWAKQFGCADYLSIFSMVLAIILFVITLGFSSVFEILHRYVMILSTINAIICFVESALILFDASPFNMQQILLPITFTTLGMCVSIYGYNLIYFEETSSSPFHTNLWTGKPITPEPMTYGIVKFVLLLGMCITNVVVFISKIWYKAPENEHGINEEANGRGDEPLPMVVIARSSQRDTRG